MFRMKSGNRLSLSQLEDRVNLGAVTTTLDFDPSTYSINDKDTWKPGFLRYEMIKVLEAGGGEITFDESINLDGLMD